MLLSLCSKVCFWEDQIFIEELLSKILLTIWSLWSADISLSAMLNMFTNTSQLIDKNKKTKEISKTRKDVLGAVCNIWLEATFIQYSPSHPKIFSFVGKLRKRWKQFYIFCLVGLE